MDLVINYLVKTVALWNLISCLMNTPKPSLVVLLVSNRHVFDQSSSNFQWGFIKRSSFSYHNHVDVSVFAVPFPTVYVLGNCIIYSDIAFTPHFFIKRLCTWSKCCICMWPLCNVVLEANVSIIDKKEASLVHVLCFNINLGARESDPPAQPEDLPTLYSDFDLLQHRLDDSTNGFVLKKRVNGDDEVFLYIFSSLWTLGFGTHSFSPFLYEIERRKIPFLNRILGFVSIPYVQIFLANHVLVLCVYACTK